MAELYKKILENEEKLDEIAKVAFENVNSNNTGEINKEQLESMINQVYHDLSNELPSKKEIDEVFAHLDRNKRGVLNFEDFKVLVKDIIKSMIEQLS